MWFCIGLMLVLLGIFQVMFLWIGKNCGQSFISQVLGVPNYGSIPQNMVRAYFAVHEWYSPARILFLWELKYYYSNISPLVIVHYKSRFRERKKEFLLPLLEFLQAKTLWIFPWKHSKKRLAMIKFLRTVGADWEYLQTASTVG